METVTAPWGLELRHNDEAVGRVFAGAVDVFLDSCDAEPRFWMGLRGLRARVSVCEVPIHIVFSRGQP
jgi:hypothetical protein